MAIPAEEPLDIRNLAREVLVAQGWSQDGPSVALAAQAFWRRVPRAQFPRVCDELAAMLMRVVLDEHKNAIISGRISGMRLSVPPSTPAPEDEVPRPERAPEIKGSLLWHTTETPGDTEEAAAQDSPQARQKAAPNGLPLAGTEDSVIATLAEKLEERAAPGTDVALPPPPAEPVPPQPRFLSPKIQAAHELWPELGTSAEGADGHRKVVATFTLADASHQRDRFTTDRQRMERAEKHWDDIASALAATGAGTVADLPSETKDRLFQRRAA
jgi:hypothetical protein